ncbi:NADH:flavin oxidoreductase/NADH oxidase [Roseitranquillus sediminis]|uniref:NADH:flavin oxidoreductase/NADH oxidase n=1 Tax=Roseitranquillus sediminis TaxID=2809051 RepID=UPI001D0BFDAB|nr:NADH:flavin oxidoreductase/NADH oxidase [Roseitranquillus sediminis]MBM9594701.1 NADH:flavin oxidoreductase/NADH oxidase [Roseitranquillus sediminis]
MTNPLLFQTWALKGVAARNRIVVSPMCQYKSVDGSPTDWHLVNLGRYAIGGAGVVFYEETAVEARGRKTPHCAGLFDDAQVPLYRRIAGFLKSLGSVPAMQLGHSGSRGSEMGPMQGRASLEQDGGEAWQAISASDIPVRAGAPAPRAMTRSEIRDVVDAFASATRRSREAGFEIMEIHGAHGYLIHQFLSPVVNRRTDAYGGSLSNRMRFALEVTEAVRAEWPDDKPLFYRASCVDGKGGIWNLDDTVALAREVARLGVDLFDCSSGGITGTSDMPLVARVPGYHLPFGRRIKEETGLPTMAPGMITEPLQAERALQDGAIDLVGMARQLMMHADWPVHAAEVLQMADPLEWLPEDFAFRLRGRKDQREMAFNRDPQPVSTWSAPEMAASGPARAGHR